MPAGTWKPSLLPCQPLFPTFPPAVFSCLVTNCQNQQHEKKFLVVWWLTTEEKIEGIQVLAMASGPKWLTSWVSWLLFPSFCSRLLNSVPLEHFRHALEVKGLCVEYYLVLFPQIHVARTLFFSFLLKLHFLEGLLWLPCLKWEPLHPHSWPSHLPFLLYFHL